MHFIKINEPIIVFMFSVIIAGSIIFYKEAQSPKLVKPEPCPMAGFCLSRPDFTNYAASMRTAIIRFLINHRENNQDFSVLNRINYSTPGTESYQIDSEFALFGERGANALYYDLSKLSTNPIQIFTFGNRVKGMGTTKSELMFLLPGISTDVCKRLEKLLNGDQVISIPKINTQSAPTETPKSLIVNLPHKAGCIKVSDNFYFYSVLIER